MNKRFDFNGGSKVNIVLYQRGPGYVVFAPPDRIDKLPDQLPIYLSRWVETDEYTTGQDNSDVFAHRRGIIESLPKTDDLFTNVIP